MNTNKNQEVFFELVKAGLWEKEVQLSQYGDFDFNEIYRLAQEQSVVGFVAAGLEYVADVKVPQALALAIAGEVLQLEQRNSAMNQFVARLVGDMRKAGIYTLLVKGQAVAQCYEKPLWRACGDVDFFLSDDNYEKAKAFLKPMASEMETEYVGAKHLGMTIDGWVVELHGSLRVGLPNRINRELDEIYTDTFKNGSVRSWNNKGTQIFTLSKENDIVYVFVHFFNHFYKEGVGLRQICDWCRLMWTYRNEIDVEKIENHIRRMGLTTEWKAFYNLASRYLGMPDLVQGSRFKINGPCLMVHDSRFDKKTDRIMEFILKSGNMGHNRGSGFMVKGSWLGRQYVVRKAFSMFRRIGDLINHARIFPLDSLRFFPRIMFNGVRSAMRGE
jgi:hypothetical protein